MPKIKICGITNSQDALLACDLGADALGFIFAPSPRNIDKNTAGQLSKILPPFITRVGVFVNESVKLVNETILECGLDAVQLHGEETPEYCARIMGRVIKTFRVGENQDVSALNSEINKYEPFVSAFLFDTYSRNQYGGTGKTFNWNYLKEIQTNKQIIVSGGLTPDNAPDLLEVFKPYAIDISSGVEASLGQKDPEKLKQLFKLLKDI